MKQVSINNFLYPILSAILPNKYQNIRLPKRKIDINVDFIASLALYTLSITTARYNVIVSTISEISENARRYNQTFFCVVRSCLIPCRVFL